MSNVKKVISYLFALSFFFLFQNAISAQEIENAYGIKISEEEYENLKELGFTDLAINQMDREVFDANKNLIVDSKSEVTKYYEVVEEVSDVQKDSSRSLLMNEKNPMYVSTELSEEEYFARVDRVKNGVQTFASSDQTVTSYRRLTTSIQRIQSTIRLHSKFVWDVMPKTRNIDVLSTSIDSTFSPVAGSEHGQQLWSYTNPTNGGLYGGNASYSKGSSAYTRGAAGYGVKMNLKDDASGARLVDLEGYMYFNIAKNSSVVPRYINAYGNYSHLTTTNSIGYSYGLSFGGPAISWAGVSGSSFDTITTHAQVAY